MNKKKELIEYHDKYGSIPKDFGERFAFLIDKLRLNMKEIDEIRHSLGKLLKAKWDNYNFVFYMLPKATPRARRSGRTGVFYVKGASDNYQMFKEFIAAHHDEFKIVTTPNKLFVDLYLPMPENMSKKEKILAELRQIYPISKPDWDNAGKTYSDMIQTNLLLEDCTVCQGLVRKFYSIRPRIELRLEFMTKYDCKYNKKKVESWKTYKDSPFDIEDTDYIV